MLTAYEYIIISDVCISGLCNYYSYPSYYYATSTLQHYKTIMVCNSSAEPTPYNYDGLSGVSPVTPDRFHTHSFPASNSLLACGDETEKEKVNKQKSAYVSFILRYFLCTSTRLGSLLSPTRGALTEWIILLFTGFLPVATSKDLRTRSVVDAG